MRDEFQEWFKSQSFYQQLIYIHGDSLFLFDDDIGYRTLVVQVAWVAYNKCDPDFVL